MVDSQSTTTQIQAVLDLAAAGSDEAYDDLIDVASERLMRLTRKMLRSYPSLRRWEQTDDVFQTAVMRLHRSLSDVQPENVRGFFGLASMQIRRTLIDLARHHFGPEGKAAQHETNAERSSRGGGIVEHQPDPSNSPESLEMWAAFHAAVDDLPEEIRETFSLIWYGGTTQKQAAALLGISERTVIRRFYQARLSLQRAIREQEDSSHGNR